MASFCLRVAGAAILLIQATAAYPHAKAGPFDLLKRQSASQAQNSTNPLQVDLGYEVYQGVANKSTGLNTFKGIRYAAPPVGSLRWQPPQPPASNRSNVISAASFAERCPQAPPDTATPGTFSTAGQSEDCLFLSVYAPPNATKLPVLVWIHGGGYGEGDGTQDLSSIINTNGNGFIGVAIQYRLGAFGFLASDELYRNGIVNAGIYDQHFALQWVQSYISNFGGDPTQVTIAGESAGGGSVMLLDMAYGGTLGVSLFKNTIAASPYLPQQYGYKDWVPSQSYYAFAGAVGCGANDAYGNSSQTIFECLISRDTETLQQASFSISISGTYGTWGFLPVTDGTLIQQTPSQQLLKRQVNGINALVGNNAEEGASFVAHNITTEDDLVAWIKVDFPLFTNDDIARLLYYYPSSNASDSPSDPKFATSGDMGATAVNVSQQASGQQQRANDIYSETTFICPSYWIAEAYTGTHGGSGYKYQYSVPNALHGSDVSAYFGPPTPNQGPDFVRAFQKIWGNFIITSDPSISNDIANGASSNSTSTNAASSWPAFSLASPYQINLNETGGMPFISSSSSTANITEYREPGLQNDITLVNAYTWEGGRGERCDFWRSVAALVPE